MTISSIPDRSHTLTLTDGAGPPHTGHESHTPDSSDDDGSLGLLPTELFADSFDSLADHTALTDAPITREPPDPIQEIRVRPALPRTPVASTSSAQTGPSSSAPEAQTRQSKRSGIPVSSALPRTPTQPPKDCTPTPVAEPTTATEPTPAAPAPSTHRADQDIPVHSALPRSPAPVSTPAAPQPSADAPANPRLPHSPATREQPDREAKHGPKNYLIQSETDF